jgi:hypothetical protein
VAPGRGARPTLRRWAIGIVVLALLASPALADEDGIRVELTPFIGYRWGGEFNDLSDPAVEALTIDDARSYGLALGFLTGDDTELYVLWSRQEADLRGVGSAFPGGSQVLSDVDVDSYQFGGLYLPGPPEARMRHFIGFSVGASHLSPPGGLDGRTDLSFSFLGGTKIYLGRRCGVRLQAGWTSTLVSGDSTIFCSSLGICYVTVEGDTVDQIEALAGFIVRF